ncbi:MAG: oxidoreductase, partial [Gemmatimonadetes bacterium]
MRVVRVGVIGCGYWGPNLVRNFARHPHCQVEAVCDMRYERAVRLGGQYRVPMITDRPDELLHGRELDLVVIATPSFTHHKLAKAALEAGKHVLVMKPLATRLSDAEELCELAGRLGLLLAVDHTFVFTGAVRRMKQLIDAGSIGDLYYFDSVRINLGLFQTDVNVVWDLAPHDVAIMDYLIGHEPITVSATGASHGGSPTENIAYVTVRYQGSLIGHVHVNWLAPAKVRRTILGGSKMMMIYDDMEPSEKLKVYDKGFSIATDLSVEKEYQQMISYRSGDMHAPQLDTREALAIEVDNVIDTI